MTCRSGWVGFSFYCETEELKGAATINFDPVTEIGGESIRLGQHGGQPHRSAFFGRQKGKAVWVGGWRKWRRVVTYVVWPKWAGLGAGGRSAANEKLRC